MNQCVCEIIVKRIGGNWYLSWPKIWNKLFIKQAAAAVSSIVFVQNKQFFCDMTDIRAMLGYVYLRSNTIVMLIIL